MHAEVIVDFTKQARSMLLDPTPEEVAKYNQAHAAREKVRRDTHAQSAQNRYKICKEHLTNLTNDTSAELGVRQAQEHLAREKARLEEMKAAFAIEKEERKQGEIDARIWAEQAHERAAKNKADFKKAEEAREQRRRVLHEKFLEQDRRYEAEQQAKQQKREEEQREQREYFGNVFRQQERRLDPLTSFCKGAQCQQGDKINTCYRRRSLELHPDKNPHDIQAANTNMAHLNNLYAEAKTVGNWENHKC